ncbi:unnamed protein product [Clonostachys rhizophaga]|uniref:Amine oxidase n=1 Tax=Clonostachys rhizophaga TaxID=160324 RepID=A0A9N9W470_9HYPO|nr:unnamed protein product [Clonostachys rhizophaga]
MKTCEGYLYKRDGTFQQGLVCTGAILPPTNISPLSSEIFDVIVLGAGFAGLTACRDLTLSGYKVLLLDARDRVGGRTYTANVDGHLYEMGGTWVHWQQPHVYREMSRYGFTKMVDSINSDTGCNYSTVTVNGETTHLNKDDEFNAVTKSVEEFCNVDGESGHLIMPFPHDPHFNPEVAKYEKLLAAERMEQVRSKLNDLQIVVLEAAISASSGSSLENTSFFEILRWWALCNYSITGLSDSPERYKIAAGQSEFARAFFDEALATGNLSYSFGTHIRSVKDYGNMVALFSRSGEHFSGKRAVCTVPLNILHELKFEPNLSRKKTSASHQGHMNFCSKYHIESRFISVLSDGLNPAGNTQLVGFAHESPVQGQEEGRDVLATAKKIHEMDIKKVVRILYLYTYCSFTYEATSYQVWHNWVADPFSRGTWAMFPPNFSFKYLEALWQRHGNVLFASGDWALGWRGFIDGAVEEGTRVAKEIAVELGHPHPVAPSSQTKAYIKPLL